VIRGLGRAVACACLATLVAACGEPGRGATFPQFEGGSRRVEAAPAEELWAVGGDPADTLLLLPVGIAARGDLVYLLDRFGSRVAALEANTGAHRWTRGRRGAGPGEMDAPRELGLAVDGGLAVADGRNPRIARVSADGQAAAPVPLRETGSVHSVCSLPAGNWLVATHDPEARLARLDSVGAVLKRYQLPGPYEPDAPALATQVLLAGGGGAPCVLLFRLGAGFAVFEGDGFDAFRLFVEPMTPPPVEVRVDGRRTSVRLTEQRTAALDGAVVDGEIWVLFDGASEDAGRLIDRYELETGEYVGSWRLPFRADRFAADDERLYALARRTGYPVAVALRRPDRPALP